MGFFKKKHDPISDRARSLQKQIEALEAQIVQLSAKAQAQPPEEKTVTQPAPAPEPPPLKSKLIEPPPAQAPKSEPHPAPLPDLEPAPPSSQPRLRSTALPHGPTIVPQPPSPTPPAEPIFEEVSRNPFKVTGEAPKSAPNPEELGVRKTGFAALWQRFKNQFRGPATSNPKLVSYLAAGSLQGLRPLRYEKRVARNRAIFLIVVLFMALWWLVIILIKR